MMAAAAIAAFADTALTMLLLYAERFAARAPGYAVMAPMLRAARQHAASALQQRENVLPFARSQAARTRSNMLLSAPPLHAAALPCRRDIFSRRAVHALPQQSA
jgi:hypothetical protein